jgi:hypothetical protein
LDEAEQALTEQAFQAFLEGDSDFPQIFVLDDILAALALAALGAAVGWLVNRCLNHEFNEDKLRRLVRWSCKQAAQIPQAKVAHLTAEQIDAEYGDRYHRALKTTYLRTDVAALRASRPVALMALPDLPEDA